jgi:thiamine biosynthesis lipoprotein
MQKLEIEGIGSRWIIQIFDEIDSGWLSDIKLKIEICIEKFDKNYSRFRKDSLIYRMSKSSGIFDLPDDAKPMFDLYQKLNLITSGLFTPLIGRVMEESGYDANYSLVSKKINTLPRWDEVLSYNFSSIEMKIPFTLDLGGIGKGYLIDIVSNILKLNSIQNYSVYAGGDLIFKTNQSRKLKVGLENPENIKQVIGAVEIKNKSICGSAGNRRKWGKYHHIINPKTKSSNWDILATWVIAEEAIIADAMATSLFLVEPAKLIRDFDFEYLILNNDFSVNKSAGFNVELF